SPVLEASLLPIGASAAAEPAQAPAKVWSLREMERRHIAHVLSHTQWNKRRACALLEISRPTLDRKIDEYALRRAVPGASTEHKVDARAGARERREEDA